MKSKEISDFTQFSKDSLLVFGVLAWNFIYISKMNRFNRFYWKISIFSMFWSISCAWWHDILENQYQTWNLLGLQSKQKKLHIYWLFWKINTQHLWNLCGSSHSFCVSSVISYTKDCGEKFQKVQKLIKSFSSIPIFNTSWQKKTHSSPQRFDRHYWSLLCRCIMSKLQIFWKYFSHS